MRDLKRQIIFPSVYGLDPNCEFNKHKLFIEKVFTRPVIQESIRRTEQDIQSVLSVSKCAKTSYRTALKSDMFSSAFGYFIADVIREKHGISVSISGNDDSKPDLYFDQENLSSEIKATTGENWSGGEYSDRPFPTILVSYDLNRSEYFVCLIPLIEQWKSNMKHRQYRTTLSWKSVRNSRKIILYGEIQIVDSSGRRIKGRMLREKI